MIELYEHFSVNFFSNILLHKYIKKNFKELVDEYNEKVKYNLFLDDDTRKKIIETYNYNLKIKNVMNKFIFKWRFNKTSSINQTTLCLESIDDIDSKDKIVLFSKNIKYTFVYKELVKIFLNSLEKQDDIFPTPEIPCNPYTNEEFKIYEIVYIYDKLKDIYRRLGKDIPITIRIFKECSFNIYKLIAHHRGYIIYTSCKNYVHSLDEKEWKLLLLDFLEDYYLEKKICLQCLYSINNYQEIFNKILISYHLQTNFFRKELKIKKKFINLCKTYNIYENTSKCSHRRIFRAKRNNVFIFNPPSNESTNFNFVDENIDLKNFTFTANQ